MFVNFLTKLKYYWALAFIIAAIALSYSHFKSESNDSKYYTQLVVRYQNENWKSLITPKWGVNYWGFEPNSYMTDQFPGQLMMGVALTKIGIPAEQALHILGLFFQVSSFFLVFSILAEFLDRGMAASALYGLLFVPLSFSYNIRANHELGIMFFSFLSLLAGLRCPDQKKYFFLSFLSTLFLLFIKGPFFIFGIALFAIGFISSPSIKTHPPKWSWGIGVVIMNIFLVILASYLYDQLFTHLSGISFLESFYRIQITNRALNAEHHHSFLIQKILNFYYYFSHYLAYSLPWILIFVICLYGKNFRAQLIKQIKTKISLCLLLSSLSFICFFMMSDRTAGRYVFPGYYLFSTWVIIMILLSSEPIKKLHLKLLQHSKFPMIVATFWLLTVCLHFIF